MNEFGGDFRDIADDWNQLGRAVHAPVTFTRIDIDDNKMKDVNHKLKKLAEEFDAYAKQKNIPEQVDTFMKENDVENRIRRAEKKADELAKEFVERNELEQWAKDHNLDDRLNEVHGIIQDGVKVTNFTDPTIGVQVTDMNLNVQLSQDDVMFMGFVGVIMMAFIGAMADKFKPAKKVEFEFEVDTEAVPVPTQKENKKAIKKTLKNIMAKNNVKTTLIQWKINHLTQ